MSKTILLSDLWEKTCQGQQSAYESLHQQLYAELHSYLCQMSRDAALADDLLQDLFVKIWVKRKEIGSITHVKAYFYSGCRLMYINHYRKEKRRQSRLMFLPVDEIELCVEEKIANSESGAYLGRHLSLAIQKLPDRQKEMVYLRYFEEMEYDQIAEITGIKYQSVINHVFRAIQVLRSEIKATKPTYAYSLPSYLNDEMLQATSPMFG